MITKFAILLFAGACFAFPADEEPLPPNTAAAPAVPPQAIPPPPGPLEPLSEGQLHDGPVPPQGHVDGQPQDDLKTDNTFWYRRSYYPYIYRRSYYRPRSYSYSYYSPYYSYWNPYYWW